MRHIGVGDKIYVVSEADIREKDHRLPAGMPYRLHLAIEPNALSDVDTAHKLLTDIARAENRQWTRRMAIAGIAAGFASALASTLLGVCVSLDDWVPRVTNTLT